MATAIKIKSVTNNLDGTTVAALIAGVPNGGINFFASRTPDLSKATAVTSSLVSGFTYTVNLPAPVLWWIWAQDLSGTTIAPVPVWCSGSPDTMTNMIGMKLQSILEANQPALDLALSQLFTQQSVKQIIYGDPSNIRNFPAILITKPQHNQEYSTYGWGKLHRITFEIFSLILHQDNTPYMRASVDFMDRVLSILNQPAYSSFTVADGIAVALAQCTSGDAQDMEIEENKWSAIGSIVWSGEVLIIDSYGAPN